MIRQNQQTGDYQRKTYSNDNPPPKRPYDPTNNKGRGYRYLWAIYPDYWAKSWGMKPCLGYVRADTEFDAKYAAYDKGLLPLNSTFGPAPVLQEKPRPKRSFERN